MGRKSVILLILSTAGCTTPAIIATRSIQEGDRMNNENRYEEAIQHYKEYLKISPQLGLYRNSSQEADVSRKLAHAYATQGKYRESYSYLTKALSIDSMLSANVLEMIDDYREIGVVKAYMGDYPEALKYLNKSLKMNEGMDKSAKDVKRTSLADTYLSLAQVNLTLGNFKEANRFGKSALDIYGKIPDEAAGLIESNLLLGIVQRDLSNLEEAVTTLKVSEQAARNAGLNTARQHQALGEVYFLQGEAEEGVRHQMFAIEQAEKSRIKPQMVMMYMRMGDAYQKLGDPKKAEFLYQKAMSVKMDMDADTLGFIPASNMRFADAEKAYHYYTRSGAIMGTALVSLRLGELRSQEGDLDSALTMFSKAHNAFAKAGSKEGMAKANLELAKIHGRKKNYKPALAHLATARSLTLQPDLAWQIQFSKGTVEESAGAYDSAYQSYYESIAIIDGMRGNISIEEFKTLFANAKVEVYDRMIVLLLNKKISGLTPKQAVREAFNYNEQARSRTFLDMLGNKKIEPKNIADTALLEKEQLLRLKIQQLSKQLSVTDDLATQKVLSGELDQTYREFDQVLSNIKLNNPAYSTVMNVTPPSIKEIQENIEPGTAILEYWVSEESLIIWVLSRDDITATSVSVTKRDFHRLLRGCRNAISYGDMPVMEQSLKKLHTLLISPVYEKIKNFKNLVMVPHRSLHFLPFQALLSNKNTFLVEDFIITYAPASSIYFYCRQRNTHAGEAFLGMALADLTIGKHASLPGTLSEIDLLSQLYTQFERRYGAECEETYIKRRIKDFDYVHIATHGVFNEQQPVHSYLLMAPTPQDDGKLTVDEIFALDIRSRLVTLSACETGLGELSEGDELVGLSRAFIYAGSAAVLVSLWKVEDSSTAFLMTRLHQYINSGNTAGVALCLAQRDLIHKKLDQSANKDFRSAALQNLTSSIDIKTIDNPFFWAPFILVGNGDVR
ncbi:MAG: CHAT domain-containing protein [Cyclobacteriaceae bacterium]